MSHFSVLIIGENVEEQLAPFQENNMEDCPKEYLVFQDVEDEERAKYDKETTNCYIDPAGKAYCKYNERFKNRKKSLFDFNSPDYICPKGWYEKDVLVKEAYSFQEYMEGYCGYKKDEVLGRYGYWENPNAKWDYWRIGGRFRAHFLLKPEFAGKYDIPEKSWEWKFDIKNLSKAIEKDNGLYSDQALKSEIDWGTMRGEARAKAAEEYDFAMSFLGHLPINLTWEEIITEQPDIDKAREQFWTQPRCKAWKEKEKEKGDFIFNYSQSPDDFIISRENYIQCEENAAISTFAVIKDGKWYQRGEMGWWGIVGNAKDQETWNSMFWNLIKDLPDDEKLTVVDCHI